MARALTPAKKKAWQAFSEYIRVRDSLKTTGTRTRCICVTCGREYPSFGVGCIQAGHFIASRVNSILFDERNCAAQCYGCNVGRGGAHVDYFVWMEKEYGREVIDDLMSKRYTAVRFTADDYLQIEKRFKRKTDKLLRGIMKRTGEYPN